MKHVSLGGLDVSRIGLGAMTMAGTYTSGGGLDDAESIRTIHRALDLGVTHIDTAEIYGPFHSEELVGQAIKGRRDQVVHGHEVRPRLARRRRPRRPRQQPGEHPRPPSRARCKRLGTDHIDLYYQHRVDPNTPIEETVGALAELVAEGKVRHIGLSEAGPEHDPPRPRRAPGRRAADRVLAVDPRSRGRAAAAAARARHRLRPLLAARPRLPHRADPHRRRLRRRRLAQDQPPLHRRELPAQPAHRRRGRRPSPPRSAPRRRRSRWPGCSPRATTSPRSPAPGGSPASRRTPPPTRVELSAEQIERLNNLTPAAGERHDEANMAVHRPLTSAAPLSVCFPGPSGWGTLTTIFSVCALLSR